MLKVVVTLRVVRRFVIDVQLVALLRLRRLSSSCVVASVRFAEEGSEGGVYPPLHEDDFPTVTCLGVSFDHPEGFEEQLDKTWGTK